MTREETRNLLKTTQISKVVNAFTRALAPPFIGRRRDFYIPKILSDPRNIHSVNMYMNVFYISCIYKPATSSHTKPGLIVTTSLTWFPTDLWISPLKKSSYAMTSELELQKILELCRFPISWFRRFVTPGLHRFTTSWASQVQDSRSSQVRDSRLRRSSGFGSSQVRDFGASQVQDSRSSQVHDSELRRSRASDLHKFAISELHRFKIPENSFHEFRKTRRFEVDRFFWIPQHLVFMEVTHVTGKSLS
jgi:hypothetical protein